MSTVSTDERSKLLREAIRLAGHCEQGAGGPFGAVIVRRRKIVARGWNKVVSTNDPTAHAEVVAIRAACRAVKHFHLKGCQLYTSCEPCPMCLAAAYWAQVDEIIYAATRRDAARIGFSDAALYREIAREPNRRTVPMHQLLRVESVEMMNRWHKMPGRILY
jgi:guanine deaminase